MRMRPSLLFGALHTRTVVTFLMNLNPVPSRVYLTRHGESQFNVMGLIGGDSALSAQGRK